MHRKEFIKIMATLPLSGIAGPASSLRKFSNELNPTDKLPVLFLGHGSPMNAIEENEFVQGFRKIGQTFEKTESNLSDLSALGDTWNICYRHGASGYNP